VLDGASAPAAPVNYNQPGTNYVKGHVGIVITGANETTNLLVFTVGRATAFDPTGSYDILKAPTPGGANDPARNGSSLFTGQANTIYDGFADIAFVAISSTNGKFGGLRTANSTYWATKGFTGVFAPGVEFTGPVYVGDINAMGADVVPYLLIGKADGNTWITGGDLKQDNGKPVQVSGLTQLKFAAGSNSGGAIFNAQTNKAVLMQAGMDVTSATVVNP
jgi:hypothetical protein